MDDMSGSKALKNKVAIITGAGRGIGQAIAKAYANEGAFICCAARTFAEIEVTVNEIEQNGGKGIAVQTDVTNLQSVENMMTATIEAYEGIDILVINAGGDYDRRQVVNSISEDWLKTMEVNLIGAYYCAKAVIPWMKQRGGGKIITIGSGLGHRGSIPANSAYACSKAGLWMLTRILAQELWQDNISVNELIPGPVKTTIDKHIFSNEIPFPAFDSEWVKEPEDVVPLATFLAIQSDTGPTGQSYSLMRRDL